MNKKATSTNQGSKIKTELILQKIQSTQQIKENAF